MINHLKDPTIHQQSSQNEETTQEEEEEEDEDELPFHIELNHTYF